MYIEKYKKYNHRKKSRSKIKNKLTFVAVISEKSLDIVFEKNVDKVKGVDKTM